MNKIRGFIYWAPRVLGIAFIIFLSIFSLDVFQPGLSAEEIAIGLFMHNLPSLVLLILLAIAWKYEIVGSIAFAAGGLIYIAWSAIDTWPQWWLALSWSAIIALPAFLIAVLFWINWIKK